MKERMKDFEWERCPKHIDKKPSLCVNNIWNGKFPPGYFYCYSCGYHGTRKGYTSTKKRKVAPINWSSLSDTYMDDWRWNIDDNNEKPFDVPRSVLEDYGMGWDGETFTFPMHNEKEEVIGIQRRFKDGKRAVPGSCLGLFLPLTLGKKVGICEGVSDACTATMCGLPTIGLPCASFGHQMCLNFINTRNIKEIVLIGDNNVAGRISVEKMRKLLDKRGGICYNVLMAENYKDLREYYEDNGKRVTIRLLKGE